MAQAVTIVASGGIPVVSTTSPSALPVTMKASGGRPVTLVTSGGLPVTFISETGTSEDLIARATASNNGVTPLHFFDFANNRALFNSADVGTISSIPNLSGTLNLVAGVGHRVAAAANILLITSPGMAFPFSMQAVFTRTTDTGLAETLANATIGGNQQNVANIQIAATDVARSVLTTANVNQASTGVATVTTTGVRYKIAGRFATNSVNCALNGVLATEDTVATVFTSPNALNIGGNVVGAQNLLGDIESISIFSSALSDALLQTVTT